MRKHSLVHVLVQDVYGEGTKEKRRENEKEKEKDKKMIFFYFNTICTSI